MQEQDRIQNSRIHDHRDRKKGHCKSLSASNLDPDDEREFLPLLSIIRSLEEDDHHHHQSDHSEEPPLNRYQRRRSASLDAIDLYNSHNHPGLPQVDEEHEGCDEGNDTASVDEEEEEEEEESRSLWIGNIDPTLSEKDVRSAFAPFGPIESVRMLREKDCVFVNFFDIRDARRAKDEMQGHPLGNMIVRIGYGKQPHSGRLRTANIAHNSSSGNSNNNNNNNNGRHGHSHNNSESGQMDPSRSLWIGNLSSSTTAPDLEHVFKSKGHIESCRVLEGKSCAFVNYFSIEDAIRAKKEFTGSFIGGNPIRIGFAKCPSIISPLSPSKSVKGATPSSSFKSSTSNNCAPSLIPSAVTLSPPLSLTSSTNSSLLCVKCNVRHAEVRLLQCSHVFCPECSHGQRVVDPEAICPVCSCNVAEVVLLPQRSNKVLPNFSLEIPPLPSSHLDQPRLREVRKKLDSTDLTPSQYSSLVAELLPQTVALSFDHVGNTIVQKILDRAAEKSNNNRGAFEDCRQAVADKLAPHMAGLGVHKNGTWVVQKLIDIARDLPSSSSPSVRSRAALDQLQKTVVNSLLPYTVAMLHDQFGNYAVQGCLAFKANNQFIFDAFAACTLEVGQSRFGSRAFKSILESPLVSMGQKSQASLLIIDRALPLVRDQNGVLLVQWLLDSSPLQHRFRLLARQLRSHIPSLSLHKYGSAVIAKLVSTASGGGDPASEHCDIVIDEMFHPQVLATLVNDPVATSILQKCLILRPSLRLVDRLRSALSGRVHQNRLLEEMERIEERLKRNEFDESQDFSLFEHSRSSSGVLTSSPVSEHHHSRAIPPDFGPLAPSAPIPIHRPTKREQHGPALFDAFAASKSLDASHLPSPYSHPRSSHPSSPLFTSDLLSRFSPKRDIWKF